MDDNIGWKVAKPEICAIIMDIYYVSLNRRLMKESWEMVKPEICVVVMVIYFCFYEQLDNRMEGGKA